MSIVSVEQEGEGRSVQRRNQRSAWRPPKRLVGSSRFLAATRCVSRMEKDSSRASHAIDTAQERPDEIPTRGSLAHHSAPR
jgi:hypothetical protein